MSETVTNPDAITHEITHEVNTHGMNTHEINKALLITVAVGASALYEFFMWQH